MIRTLLWVLAGVFLGGVIHIVSVLALPSQAVNDAWSRIAALDTLGKATVLEVPMSGQANPLQLDPNMAYAVCQLDLRSGPGVVSGLLPGAFWSLAVYDRNGTITYSTTNRDGIGRTLDLGIFNPAQTRLLAEQKLDVAEGLLIIESQRDDIFVLVRLALPHPEMRARYEAELGRIFCGNYR